MIMYGAGDLAGEVTPPPPGHALIKFGWRLQDLSTGRFVAQGVSADAVSALTMMNTAAFDWKRAS